MQGSLCRLYEQYLKVGCPAWRRDLNSVATASSYQSPSNRGSVGDASTARVDLLGSDYAVQWLPRRPPIVHLPRILGRPARDPPQRIGVPPTVVDLDCIWYSFDPSVLYRCPPPCGNGKGILVLSRSGPRPRRSDSFESPLSNAYPFLPFLGRLGCSSYRSRCERRCPSVTATRAAPMPRASFAGVGSGVSRSVIGARSGRNW